MSILIAIAAVLAAGKPEFKVTTKRGNDRLTWRAEKGVTVIDVRSPFGISDATIERTGDAWPETVTLRLHLTGLESFSATCGKAELHGAASGGERQIKLTVGGKAPPGRDNIDFKAVGKNGKPTGELPLEDGYFEMELPKAFFEGNPKSFKLAWVDWYRR